MHTFPEITARLKRAESQFRELIKEFQGVTKYL
jgi:hypothetical protein